MMKKGKIFGWLAVLTLGFFFAASAYAVQYGRTDTYPAGDTATSLHDFSNGFDITSIEFQADSDVQTVEVTFTVACMAGNGNPTDTTSGSQWSLCESLDNSAATSLGQTCFDANPDLDCDGVPNARDDAPDTRTAETELYSFSMDQSGKPGLKIEIRPAKGSPNVTVASGAGVTVSPTFINFGALQARSFTFTIGNISPSVLDLTLPWTYTALANAQFDGPGEDIVSDSVNPPAPPEFRCVGKTFDGQSSLFLPMGSVPTNVTAVVTIENTSPAAADPITFEITDTLDVGLTYVDGSTSGAYILGEPTKSLLGDGRQQLVWLTSEVPPGVTFTLTYSVNVGSLSPGEVKMNNVEVISPEVPDSSSLCAASVRTVAVGVPVTAWASAIALLIFLLTGVYFIRRKRKATA